MAIGARSEIWIVECKSSVEDFKSDNKWQGYLEWAERFFWAVGPDFPVDLLPMESGLIIADDYDGEIIRMPEKLPLSAARRKSILLKFARNAADRLVQFKDPNPAAKLTPLE